MTSGPGTHVQLIAGKNAGGRGSGVLRPYQDCLGVLQAACTRVYMWFHLALLGCSQQTLTLVNFSKKEFIGRMSGAHRSDRSPEKQTPGGRESRPLPKAWIGIRSHHLVAENIWSACCPAETSDLQLCPLSLSPVPFVTLCACLLSDDPSFLGWKKFPALKVGGKLPSLAPRVA